MNLWAILGSLAGGIVAIIGAFLTGRRSARDQEAARRGEDYVQTSERMSDENYRRDADIARDSLRQRGQR